MAASTYTMREVLDFCTHHLPALAGDIGPSETYSSEEAAEQMGGIFTRLAQAYPEAQAIYWGCRTWQLWLWQPVFIGVWAASVKGVSVDFNGFRHRMGDLFTDRFLIDEQILAVQTVEESIVQTAARLKSWLLRQLALIQPYYKITDKLAGYFLGDAILKALVVAQRFGLLTAQQTLAMEKIWHQTLNLRCKGWLVWQEDAHEFLVEMTACCQHYRREGAEYCAGCPKLRQKCRCRQEQ